MIGGGDWSEDRLIPDCIKAWSRKNIVKIRNPNSTRPWQHVLEALRGYLTLQVQMQKNKKIHGEAFNFGPKDNQNKKVIQLVEEIKKNWKNISWLIEKSNKENLESNLLKLNSNKAKKKLGWVPILSFSTTIEMISNWYKNFYNKKNVDIEKFTKDQIIQYGKKIKLK